LNRPNNCVNQNFAKFFTPAIGPSAIVDECIPGIKLKHSAWDLYSVQAFDWRSEINDPVANAD
jgi:hypothetical protein